MPSNSAQALNDSALGTRPEELRVKLLWVTVFRTVATTLLLAVIAARLLSRGAPEPLSTADSLSFMLIGAVYVSTIGYALVLRRGRVTERAAYVQVLGDVVLASCLVYLTGGVESPFTFTYSLAVVAASILLYHRGAFVAATSSSLAFIGLTVAVQTEVLKAPPGSSSLDLGRLLFLLLSNILAQFLIAALASYLSRQLWTAGGQLSEREADLRELARLQRQILSAMPSGLLTCEADGRVTYVNRAAVQILGLDQEERAGTRSIDQLLPGALHLGPRSRRGELTVETPHGTKTLGLSVTHLEGRHRSYLVVFQDLTDLRQAEEELRRVDHLAALGKLAAQLAHEIRNPLASMRGSAQMLAADKADDAPSARLCNILVRESDRLSQLVEDFLRFARPPPPTLRPCELDALVRETADLILRDPMAQGIALEVSAPAPVVVDIDPDQIRQVLLNLLRNAFAATGPNGRVLIRVEQRQEGARLVVWDSGGSIPAANLTRIFHPFFTTREGGTGLGLSTAHSIVRSHGGMIQVTSSPSEGTEFTVDFPAHSEASLVDSGR